MNHKITSIQELYDTAVNLDNSVVKGTADVIIKTLEEGIEKLKETWKGIDAGVQIQNVVEVHNAMVEIRNKLSVLASTSAEVAIKYRSIQIQNRAQLDMLSPISVTTKTKLDAYVDTSDSIDISSDALVGKNKILNAKINLVTFISEVNETYGMIMDKWQAGPGRDTAQAAYDEFIAKAKDYSEILENVAQSITDALSNYSIIE